MHRLVLASTSPFRKQLLARLGLSFDTVGADIDEKALPGEKAELLVRRLAEAKAQAVARGYPSALVIGADQVAVMDDAILGKPNLREQAARQLRWFSGKSVTFFTGVCLLNSSNGRMQGEVVPYTAVFRSLSERQIMSYLEREQPYNCAGSLKSEGLGISLLKRLTGEDPTALIGLPLISLTRMLENEGVQVL